MSSHNRHPSIEEIADSMGSRCLTTREITECLGSISYRYVDETLHCMQKARIVEKVW